MTHDEMIAVIQADKEGKQIQRTCGKLAWENKTESEPYIFSQDSDGWRYRIKPTPKRVPLGPDDFPPGTVLKNPANGLGYAIVTAVDIERVHGNGTKWTFEELAHAYHFLLRRLPGSTEWLPCWREE